MIHASVVISLVLCRPYENVIVPFVIEESNIANGEVNVLVLRISDKGGKVVVIAPDIHKFPTVKFTEGA